VESVGPGVKLAVGTRVLALTRFFGQATRVVVPEPFAQALPDEMSFDEAAALPVVYVTAFHMLFNIRNLRPGMHVLVHMAAGGVGLAVVELAKTVKDVTLYGTASASKHDFLRQAGVHHPIDYRTQDYAEEVRAISAREHGGRGLDLVLDPLGGPDWKKGYSLLRPTGHLIAYGWSNMNGGGDSRSLLRLGSQFLQMPRFAPLELMDKNRTVSGVNVGHLWDASDVLSEVMASLLTLYREGKVKPRVDKVFPLSDGPAAHRYIQARKNIGKVLFDCS
jgi:NADPH:quinone reductase-like Zn-dependent oxidoreductase